MKPLSTYSEVFKEKQYIKIIAANIINRFGDSVDSIAFGWLVYQITGSKEWLVVIIALNQIPGIVFQPFAGALIDRINKKVCMIFCDISQGLLVLALGVLFLIHCINPWTVLTLSFLNYTVGAVRAPCGLAIIPTILKKENYSAAMSLNQSASKISELLGLGISGFIIALLGVGGAVIIDAFTFIASASILLFLKISAATDFTDHKRNYFSELKDGFLYFKSNKVIMSITTLCFFISMADVPWDNLKAAYINESLKMSVNALSIGSFTMSIGLLTGMFLYPYIAKKVNSKTIFIFAGLFIGVLYFFLVVTTFMQTDLIKLCLYGGTMLFYGMTNAMIDLALVVTFMSNVEAEYMGRAGSIFNAVASSSAPMGSFILAFVTPFMPICLIYVITGIITTSIFLGSLLLKTTRKIKSSI